VIVLGSLAACGVESYLRGGREVADAAVSFLGTPMMRWRRTVSLTSAQGGPLVASPGGWQPSSGARPGWDWVPPSGATLNVGALPLWVNLWRRTPLLARLANPWMWEHGYWLVQPAGRSAGGGDPSGDRAPIHPLRPDDEAAVALTEPAAPDTEWDIG